MPKKKSIDIETVLQVLRERRGKQKDAAIQLNTSQATISRYLKENGYVAIIQYVKESEKTS